MHTSRPDRVKAYEDLLRAAVRQAEAEHDGLTCARAYLLLSAQLQWTDEDEAIALATKAQQALQRVHIARLSPQKRETMKALQLDLMLTMAGLYEQKGEIPRARSLYQQCRRYDTCRNVALGHLANLCLSENDTAGALQLARQMTLSDDYCADIEARFILANCYLQCDSMLQARQIYTLLASLPNHKTRYVAQRHLTEIAIRLRELTTLPALLDSTFSSAESVFFEALQQKDVYFHATLEQERRAEHLAYRQRLMLWGLCGVTVLTVIVVLFLIALTRHRRQIQAQRLKAEQRERELAEERVVQQEQKILLLQHLILDKSEVLQRLRAEGDSKKQLSQKEWQEVEQMLDGVTDGFVRRLRTSHPEFSEEDIQLCMLTRMNLSNQVISSIYLITVSAVKHRKLKLKKEGFGEYDAARPLDTVLLEI